MLSAMALGAATFFFSPLEIAVSHYGSGGDFPYALCCADLAFIECALRY